MNNIPDWYCASIHAGLNIKLHPSGNISVDPCPRSPVSYVNTDNFQTFSFQPLVDFRSRNQNQKILEGKCAGCAPNSSEINCGNREFGNAEFLKNGLLFDQTGPTMITFEVSHLCNLACTTCRNTISSKWNALENIRNQVTSIDPGYLRNIIRAIDLSSLRIVHIYGGEPFMDSVNEIILEELLPYAHNITMHYDTNGTTLPSENTFKLWQSFQLIRVKFSIDGVDKNFEYLRWPAKWDQVTKNILNIKNNCPSNVMFGFRPAIGFLNLHVIGDIENWFNDNLSTNREGDKSEFEYNVTYGTYAPKHITHSMKHDLMNLYSSGPVRSIIDRCIGVDADKISFIWDHLAYIDGLRKNTNFVESLPYLKRYIV